MKSHMRMLKVTWFVIALAGTLGFANPVFGQSDVTFVADGKTTRVAAGVPVSIRGSVNELCEAAKCADWIARVQITAKYVSSKAGEKSADSTAVDTANNWTVTLPPLPLSDKGLLSVVASGRVSAEKADAIWATVNSDPGFVAGLAQLKKAISAKGSTDASYQVLVKTYVAVALAAIPAELTADFRKNVGIDGLLAQVKTPAMADESAALERVRGAATDLLTQSVPLKVSLSMPVGTNDVEGTELRRYAGVDVGAVWSWRTQELRKMALVSIYGGSIEDKPDTTTLLQGSRLSLTAGWDLGDLSGNENSDIRGKNAFFFGVGYRMSKYFRLSLGDQMYRSASNGRLGHAFAMSLSVDLTAYQILEGYVSTKEAK